MSFLLFSFFEEQGGEEPGAQGETKMYVSKRHVIEDAVSGDVTAVVLFTSPNDLTENVVLSGGVATDAGGSEVDVTEAKYVVGRQARIAPAVLGLAVIDTDLVVVDPADNTIKAVAALGTNVPLASVAVAGCPPTVTPTDTRRRLAVVIAGVEQ